MEVDLKNFKSEISEEPLIGSYSNFKLKLRWQTISYKSIKWRWPPVEDNLKILKVEYLSIHLLDIPQLLH